MKNKVINFFTNYVVILIFVVVVLSFLQINGYWIRSKFEFSSLVCVIVIILFTFISFILFRYIRIKSLRIIYFIVVSMFFELIVISFIDSFFYHDLSDDLSFVLVIPLYLLILILWGVYFNYLEKKFFRR